MSKAIVRDHNGRLRIDQADLNALDKLDELREEISDLKAEIKQLMRACDNYETTNRKLSQELSSVRWKLKEAESKIEELEKIEVSVEVVNE